MPRKTPRGVRIRPRSAASFNEAAARCHGKRPCRRWRCAHRERFNEAAARCHGKPAAVTTMLPSDASLQ